MQHYLKPYRKRILVCWGLLALAAILAVKGNFGLATLYGLPPIIYLRNVYSVAYSPGQMGMSRSQSFEMVFIGIPLAFCLLAVAIELLSDQDDSLQSSTETAFQPSESGE